MEVVQAWFAWFLGMYNQKKCSLSYPMISESSVKGTFSSVSSSSENIGQQKTQLR